MQRVNISNINAQMINNAAAQEAASSASKVWSPDFPLFQTPLNRKILVYIPKDFEERKVELLIHDTHKGKAFGQVRCINGLSDGFESLGYTGECPFCKATEDAWALYNLKLEQKAKELGIDRNNDPDDLLKGTRDNLLREMAVRNADKYICFPIVIIPSDAAGNLDTSGQTAIQACYVLWRKQRYMDKFSADTLDGRESPAGTFQRWSFTYDTKGKQATAMDSARALSIKILEKADILAQLNPYTETCEQVVAPFTNLQAIDNIKALNFYTYKDVEAEAEATIRTTRAILTAAQAMGGVEAPAVAAAPAAPQISTSAASAIANFGNVAAPAAPAAPVAPTAPEAPVIPAAPAAPQMPNLGMPGAVPQMPNIGLQAPTMPTFGS